MRVEWQQLVDSGSRLRPERTSAYYGSAPESGQAVIHQTFTAEMQTSDVM